MPKTKNALDYQKKSFASHLNHDDCAVSLTLYQVYDGGKNKYTGLGLGLRVRVRFREGCECMATLDSSYGYRIEIHLNCFQLCLCKLTWVDRSSDMIQQGWGHFLSSSAQLSLQDQIQALVWRTQTRLVKMQREVRTVRYVQRSLAERSPAVQLQQLFPCALSP